MGEGERERGGGRRERGGGRRERRGRKDICVSTLNCIIYVKIVLLKTNFNQHQLMSL